MAFMEGKLQMIDLIGALNAKRQQEEREKRSGNMGDPMIRQAQIQQLAGMGLPVTAENIDKLERGYVDFAPKVAVPDSSPYGGTHSKFLGEMGGYVGGTSPQSYFDATQRNMEAMIGRVGSGGGYGGGGGGRPQQDPYSNYAPGQLEQMNAINEYQPQQAKAGSMDSANIAALLGQLYRPGGAEQASPIADRLADERQNQAGFQSLINQSGGKIPQAMMGGTSPVQGMVDKNSQNIQSEVDTWMNTGSTVPPKHWPQEIQNAAAREKTKLKNAKKPPAESKEYSVREMRPQLLASKGYPKDDTERQKKYDTLLQEYLNWAKKKGVKPSITEMRMFFPELNEPPEQ